MDNSDKIILDLCGGTGSWSKPYKDAGYDVRLITLPEHDVTKVIFDQDGMIFVPQNGGEPVVAAYSSIYGVLAAPPCTDFASSGARWWAEKDKDGRTIGSMGVLIACLNIILKLNPKFWVMENPVGRMKSWMGPPQLTVNPCDYGDPYTKKTLLWGNFAIPEQSPVEPAEGSKMWKCYGGKSERTKMMRSITPPGFAQAFYKANK